MVRSSSIRSLGFVNPALCSCDSMWELSSPMLLRVSRMAFVNKVLPVGSLFFKYRQFVKTVYL